MNKINKVDFNRDVLYTFAHEFKEQYNNGISPFSKKTTEQIVEKICNYAWHNHVKAHAETPMRASREAVDLSNLRRRDVARMCIASLRQVHVYGGHTSTSNIISSCSKAMWATADKMLG